MSHTPRNDFERRSTRFDDLAIRYTIPASGGAISDQRLVRIASDGEVEVGTFNCTDCIGVNGQGRAVADGDSAVQVALGRTFVTADMAITAGQLLKCGYLGRATPLVTAALAGTTIEDNVGLAFTNQPANDGLEVVSGSAADTTQTVTAYYTRTGQGDTVYTETKTLTGTTEVIFTHTDIALVLAVEKSAATTGTITFREASGNGTVATLAAGTLTNGKIAVTAGQTNAYNVAPTAVANLPSTKTVGIIGTDETGATLYASKALTGADPVTFGDTFKTVTFLLTGDVESTVTATVKVGAADSYDTLVGRALSAAAAQGDRFNALIVPVAVPNAASSTVSSSLLTTDNIGSPNTGTTAVEYGDGRNHVTVLTVDTTLPAIAGGAALGVGKLLYTMPAGAISILAAKINLAITQTQGNITADTPDGGLGSVIASGAVSVLDGTPTFEDILTGQTFNDCNGTAEVKTVANQPMVMETGAAHTVHFNVADTWAASGDAAALLTGTVILHWAYMG